MKRVLTFALLGLLCFPLSVHAATLLPCNFGKFAGQVMPLPNANDLGYQILVSTTAAAVTQTVPVKSLSGTASIVWACQTATSNFSLCWSSTNTNDCGSGAPTGSTANTSWRSNPICRRLLTISGTTLNDRPNLVSAASTVTNTVINGTYCVEQ